MKTIGLARLGKDAEVRFIPSGEPVANLSLAFNYGKPDQQGDRPTQWINASLWGRRAESLVQYLTKGSVHCFTLSEMHIEQREGTDGKVYTNLVARVDDVQLGPRSQGGGERPASNAGSDRPTPRQPVGAGASAEMDDDIPF